MRHDVWKCKVCRTLYGLLCVLLLLLALVTTTSAQAPESPESVLRRYTACFTTALGVTPRWSVVVEMETDTTATYFGSSRFSAVALAATIKYNVPKITASKQNLREIALHEVVHVATGELAHLAYDADPRTAALENERLARQIVRWPNWKGVCE